MGKRYTFAAAVMLIAAGANRAIGGTPGVEVFVTARLEALDRQPDCGYLWIGSPATYYVIAGPAELVGMQIHVMIDCVEMPRQGGPEDFGDLKSFEVGATHFLALSTENVRHIESPKALPTEGPWFYLRAASLRELRPNTSLERTRGR